jgi:proteic killer suppression protein
LSAVAEFVMLDVTRNRTLSWRMIVGYRDKRTRDFSSGKPVRAFSGIKRAARLKLDRLEAATGISDRDRKGQYSIRINDQCRVCFGWPDGAAGPSNVEIVDYP